MITVNEMFANTYVIVPLYVDTCFGYQSVQKYDMTNKEWNTWMKAKALKPVKKILGDAVRQNKTSDMMQKVVDFLKGEGVRCALVNTPECTEIRNEFFA